MPQGSWTAQVVMVADYVIRAVLSVRVIMRRRPVGASLAWLAVILIFPFAGAAIYLTFGELRLGRRRAIYAARIHETYEKLLSDLRKRAEVTWSDQGASCEKLARLCEVAGGTPALPGNSWHLLGGAEAAFPSLIADIDAARRTCHLEFYIWNVGGMADLVAEALLRAAARGVICRVLVDDVGSRPFLRSDLYRRLGAGGVKLRSAMPVNPFRMLFVRFDLRLHRKVAVIDGEVAYAGSLNMADPAYFKRNAHVGQWVDAMVRVQGPAVEGLAITFLEDWELETGEGVEQLVDTGDAHAIPPKGPAIVQVVPSGPLVREESIEAVLLMAIYAARNELVLTTPYFVPDEALLMALKSAALRGVEVTLVIPARVDSKLARLASQPFKGDLLEAGVRIVQFEPGFLHTKSVTVDGEFSLFGSLNLDPRSLILNFEITLSIYDEAFTKALRALQQSYIDQSTPMDRDAWRARPHFYKFVENAARLLNPLL